MLELKQATWEQFKLNTISNFQEWGNHLNIEQYWEREEVSKQYVDGHRAWILVDSEDPNEILASCETYTQESLYCLKNSSDIKKGKSESVASVFVDPKHRNKGYASKLMKSLYQRFEIQDDRIFCDLYSDINPIVYEKCGWKKYPNSTFIIKLDDAEESKINFINSLIISDQQQQLSKTSTITEDNIDTILKKSYQQTEEILIEIANDNSKLQNYHSTSNGEIENEYVFSKVFSRKEFFCEISQAKIYSSYISDGKIPTVFGHVIYNDDSNSGDDGDIRSYILWTFDYREKTLKLLKLSAESESDFKYLIKKAYDQSIECGFTSIYAWWPTTSSNKFKKSFIDSIGNQLILREGSIPMVCSWIKLENGKSSIENYDKGIWINVERFGWC